MSVRRRRLFQNYWYKVPVLHIVKYHKLLEQIEPKNGFETEKAKNRVRIQDIYSRPPRLLWTIFADQWVGHYRSATARDSFLGVEWLIRCLPPASIRWLGWVFKAQETKKEIV